MSQAACLKHSMIMIYGDEILILVRNSDQPHTEFMLFTQELCNGWIMDTLALAGRGVFALVSGFAK